MNIPFVRTVVCALALGSTAAVAQAAPEGRPCSAEPTDMLIEYGDIVTCEISPVGDLDLFRFEGQAGERVVGQVAPQAGGDACLEVRGPGDTPLVPLGCGLDVVRFDVVLPSSGLFTVRVNEWYYDHLLQYRLVLERVTPPSPAARDVCPLCTVPDRIDPAGDLDVFTFTGRAGDTVVIQATGKDGDPCLEVFGPAGTPIGQTACGLRLVRRELRLDEDGVHTILMREWYDNNVTDYTLFLECFGTCAPTPDLRCEVEMNQAEYHIGDPLAISKLRLANHGPAAVPLEWKLWMRFPGYGDYGLVDYRFTIPKGYDQNLGPISFGQVTAPWPVGNYEVGCRFLEPASGRMRAVGHAPFAIQ
jgi:hypothetical protein